jgi:hypothetical protein
VEERDARLATLATRLQEANNNKKELARYKVYAPQPPSPFALQFSSSEGVVNQKHEVRSVMPSTRYRILVLSLVCFCVLQCCGFRFWSAGSVSKETKIEKGEEMSCFEGMDVLLLGLKASLVAWTSLWWPRDIFIAIFYPKILIYFLAVNSFTIFGLQKHGFRIRIGLKCWIRIRIETNADPQDLCL